LQLKHLFVALLLCAGLTAPARADELTIRGNYYRDRNTRVIQPEATLTKTIPTGTALSAHYLLDAITSASIAAGVLRDQPFTELRNEVGVAAAQQVGAGRIGAAYSYSTESDYWAHLASLNGSVDLFRKNTTLGLSLAYGHDAVGQRMGPTSFQIVGHLDAVHLIAGYTQVLSRIALLNLEYDASVLGFGTRDNGFQSNPYRVVNLGGSASHEKLPFQRVRMSAAASLHLIAPTGARLVPYVAFRPSYRFYWDDWGVVSHTPELRTYLPIGPVEVRLTGRWYTQRAASFWSSGADGVPLYPGNAGKGCGGCLSSSSRGQEFLTSDPKLSRFNTWYLEGRLLIQLHGLRPLSRWLSEGLVELSYGHLFNDAYAHIAYGDADLATLSFTFPL
jgi:hypothetical protein